MGYYTCFSIAVDAGTHTVSEIYEAMRNLEDETFYGVFFSEDATTDETDGCFELPCKEEVKWYDEESDMIEFSKKFPHAIFTVHGEGEERSDVWEHQYKNGKQRTRRMEYSWGAWDSPDKIFLRL